MIQTCNRSPQNEEGGMGSIYVGVSMCTDILKNVLCMGYVVSNTSTQTTYLCIYENNKEARWWQLMPLIPAREAQADVSLSSRTA